MRLEDAVSMNPDYIVVGGGPAGCVVASRLSEDPTVKVLLLEAGRDCDDPRVRIPVGVAMMVENKNWDWSFQTPPDPTIGGRRMSWSAGKCLGGGSSIHGQVNIRGLPSDYDEWASVAGAGGAWSYADLLPYFIGCENYEGADTAARGNAGPLAVSDIRDLHPLADAFVTAGEAAGYDRVDLNGATPEGFGYTQATQKDGRRFNAYDGYIRPYLSRPNLAVLTKARVRRILVEGGVAVGVEAEQGGRVVTVRAGRETIVSAGAIPSANLLMKSGIGPGEVLQAAGVPVVAERDGVGRNLQEHTGVSISRFIQGHWSLNTMKRPDKGLVGLYKLLVQRRGPLASPVVQAMGFAKTDPSLRHPDVQLHFLPFAYRMTPDAQSALTAEMPNRAAVAMQVTLCKPKTRGQIRITDADPLSAPSIDHHLLGDPRDLVTLREGCKFLTGLFAHERFSSSVVENCNPPVNPADDAGWDDYVRASCNVAYHHVGTCSMGPADDPASVVDPDLRVIGVDRLRVADASIMPVVPSSNTYIPTIVVGEKAAALIKG